MVLRSAATSLRRFHETYFKLCLTMCTIHNCTCVWDAEPVDVTVRFSAKVADYITRMPKWHKSEERASLPSGEVEISFTIAGVEEIKPEGFRREVKKEISQMLKNYQTSLSGVFISICVIRIFCLYEIRDKLFMYGVKSLPRHRAVSCLSFCQFSPAQPACQN